MPYKEFKRFYLPFSAVVVAFDLDLKRAEHQLTNLCTQAYESTVISLILSVRNRSVRNNKPNDRGRVVVSTASIAQPLKHLFGYTSSQNHLKNVPFDRQP